MDTRKVGIAAAVFGAIMLGAKAIMDRGPFASGGPPPRGLNQSLPFINRLDPSIQPMARDMLQKASNQGLDLVVTYGLRTMDEQAKLYAQGRTTPGAVVTNAPPGSSWHNFGLAFDVAVLDPNGKTTWPNNTTLWQQIGAVGKSVGLDWGGDFVTFKDQPHFEYHPNITLADARAGRRPSGSAIV